MGNFANSLPLCGHTNHGRVRGSPRERHTMTPTELSIIRTKLRDVNVEYSALVRAKAGEDRFVRMHEAKAERRALMALMAGYGGSGATLGREPRQLQQAAVPTAT